MNKSIRFFIIIAVSFAVASCTPIGTIHDNEPGADIDDFWTIPQRQYYTLGDSFERTSDLRAFASHQGMVESIPTNSPGITISLVRNPDADTPGEPIPIINGRFKLVEGIVGTGRKQIIVTYGKKTAQYSIEIRYLDGSVDPDDSSDGTGSGIGIIWR